MQEKINKLIFIMLGCLIFLLVFFIICDNFKEKKNKYKEYNSKFDALDTVFYIRIYSNNNVNKEIKKSNKIVMEYNKLVNKDKKYGNNLYAIEKNTKTDKYLKISNKLYKLLKYGYSWYKKSDGIIDISQGELLEKWQTNLEKNYVMSKSELLSYKNDINNIVLEKNKIKNNHVNINVNSYIKGYVVDEVAKYLQEKGIDKFFIDAGGVVRVGKHYNRGKYGIGLEDPKGKNNDIYKIIYLENNSVATTNYYSNYYNIKNKKYSGYLNLKTFDNINVLGTSVISKTAREADIWSNIYLVDKFEEGKNKALNNNIITTWYLKDKQYSNELFEKFENNR